jgi:hypothetical protein
VTARRILDHTKIDSIYCYLRAGFTLPVKHTDLVVISPTGSVPASMDVE